MRLFILASVSLLCLPLWAQNELDAIRYSTIGAGGSARTLGMAGAFSAIGADPSAIMINPAGIAAFRRGEFNFGLQFLNTSNKSSYLTSDLKESRLSFNLPTLNLVISQIQYDESGNPKKKGVVNFNYGFNINRLASFNNRFAFDAQNRKSSITDYFAEKANAEFTRSGSLAFGGIGDLAYYGGAIDLLNGTKYISHYSDSSRNNQQSGDVSSTGNIYEYQATFGVNFSHRVMLGLGLFYNRLVYEEELSLLETDLRAKGPAPLKPDLNTVEFQSTFADKGNAFGARFGAIVKPTEQLRIAFAIHTPRTFSIKEEYGYAVKVTSDSSGLVPPPAQKTDPLNTYDYKVSTPMKMNLGLGFVIEKIAMITADFEFYDYSTARLKAKDVSTYNAENTSLRRNYTNVVNVRLGFELNTANPDNTDQKYRYRVGFAHLPSPFSSKAAGLDEVLKKANNMYTCGFGVRDKNYYLDFALSYSKASNYYNLYSTAPNSYFPHSSVTNNQTRVAFSFTLGLNFD